LELYIHSEDVTKLYYDANTIKKTFVTLGTFLNHYNKRKAELAIELSEVFLTEDFGKVRGLTEAPPIALTENEIEILWNSNDKVEQDERLSKMRLRMLLQIGVGCRVSDLFKLGNVGRNKIGGQEIVYFPTKTETTKKKNEIRVPFNKYSAFVLEKLGYDSSKLKIADQQYNYGIKDLLQALGIESTLKEHEVTGKDGNSTYKKYEVFSSHNCRDTFITRCIELGVPVPIVMDWVGQTKFEVMRKYIKTNPKLKVELMQKFK
jgi:integrase